jgi:glycerol kinase
MASPEYILAIDQGTTGSSAFLIGHDLQVASKGYREFTQHFPKPGWVEHDASEIWRVTLEAVQEAMKKANCGPAAIQSLGITNQRETVVVWDANTGAPAAPAIVWQDRRTASFCDELKAAGHEAIVRDRTGLLLDPYFSGSKLRWLLDQHPEWRSKIDAGELLCGTMDSFLVWKLTNGAAHVTDVSNASRTLLFSLESGTWDDALCDLLGVPQAWLPEVKPSSGALGEAHPDTALGLTCPISGIAGDQQAALFGQACYTPGSVKNTYGTGAFILMNTGDHPPPPSDGLLRTAAWKLGDAPMQYALEGSVFIAGAGIQWLRDELGIIQSASETEAMARSLDSNEDVYFVPALTGLGSPYWDPYARGLLIGLTRGTNRNHFVRAALEAMAYQSRDVIEAMKDQADMAVDVLRADGGAVANTFLMQFQSDLLGIPVEVPTVSETTALGAACLAGLATGFWNSPEEIASHWACAARYEPQMLDSERETLYSRWKEAVSRARNWSLE